MAMRPKTLFGRMWLGFAAALLLVWLALLGREVHDVLVGQKAYATAENHLFARAALSLTQHLRDRPEQLRAALDEAELQRQQFWADMGFDPPAYRLQVLEAGQPAYEASQRSALAVERMGGARLSPSPAEHEGWLYVELQTPDGVLQLRRWQEIPGGWHFSANGLSYFARPLLFTLPLLMLPAWLVLRLGLRPLRKMGHSIAGRPETDLSPLPSSPYAELSPVVQAVNRLMARLELRLNREREFLVDAAHELKTPLAVVQVNAEGLLIASDPGRREAASGRLREGVQRLSHVVHQLLSLNRSHGELPAGDGASHDLVALTRDRIGLLLALANTRNIDLELESPDEAWMPMSRDSMGSLIDNLVDNAIKYTAPGGRVVVKICSKGDALAFSVSDNGPGIAPELHARVFERFYRLPDQDPPGSGLGLSIVERAAAQHRASVSLGPGLDGGGLSATVRFPR